MNYEIQTTAAIAALLLASCATKFTPAQRDALSTVAISKGTSAPDACKDPYGGDVAMRDSSANIPGAGVLGPIVGLAVGGAIAGTQNNMFVGKNQGYFAAVRKNTPNNLGEMMTAKLKSAFKGDSFFGPRLKDRSPNIVSSQITAARLVRIAKNPSGELLMAAEIYATLALKDNTGKDIAGGRSYIGRGISAATVAEYAASPQKLRKTYDDALQNAIVQFTSELAAKTR